MKAKSKMLLRGILLAIMMCFFTFALVACGDDEEEKPADPAGPEVTAVSITADGDDLGKVNKTHTLNISATDGSEITVTVKKGDVAATSADYTYTAANKSIVFMNAGNYTVTVTAKLNNKTASKDATITIIEPALTELTVTPKVAGKGGYVGQEYTVTYTVVPATSAVTISVEKDGEAAVANTDYTYDTATKTLVFLTAGEYTVTATSADSETDTTGAIEIADRTVSVTAAASVKMNEALALTIETEPEGEDVTVTLLNAADDTAVAADKYAYASGSITIKEPGSYKVKVALTGNYASVTDTTDTITVLDTRVPEFELSTTVATFAENDATGATITCSEITYTNGASKDSDEWKVEYRKNSEEEYAAATAGADTYTFTDGAFKATKAGEYKITYSVTDSNHLTGIDSVEITVTPAVLTLATTADWTDISSAINLEYTVTGDATNYDVTYSEIDGITKSDADTAAGEKVNLVATKTLITTYTVTYTHKVLTDTKYTVSFGVYANVSATGAPTFSTDAADKTLNKLIAGTSILLYAGAETADATVAYTVLDADKAQVQNVANVGDIITLKDGATGTVRVAVVATKDDVSALEIQTFTVTELSDTYTFNHYANEVASGASYANTTANSKGGLVLTKNGIVVNKNISSDLNDAGNVVNYGLSGNFRVTMRLTMLGKTSNSISLAFKPYTGTAADNATSENGGHKLAIYSDNENLKVESGCWDGNVTWFNDEPNRATYEAGKSIYIRLIHYVANDESVYILQWAPEIPTAPDVSTEPEAPEVTEGTRDADVVWTNMLIVRKAVSTTKGDMSAPVQSIGLFHERGSYMIDDISYTLNTVPSVMIDSTIPDTVRVNDEIDLKYTIANNYYEAAEAVVVKRGEINVTADVYDATTKKLSFKEAGTYTVEISLKDAAKATKAIEVKDLPAIELTISETAKNGDPVNYLYTNEGGAYEGDVAIAVEKKNGENWEAADEGTDYTIDASGQTITFNVNGTYKVTASVEEGAFSDSVEVLVTNAVAPTFTVTLDKTADVVEGDEVTVTFSTITYDTANGDSEKAGETPQLTVRYAVSGTADQDIPEENKAEYYEEVVDGETRKITLKLAGNYRIEYSIKSTLALGKAHADITVAPATLELAFNETLTNGWYRMAANDTDTDIVYDVTGNTTNYTVKYTINGVEEILTSQTTPAENKGVLSVHWTEANTYVIKVIYTHIKLLDTVEQYVLTINVSAVTDLTTSPILAEDPFGGTYTTLAPAFALALYNDVYAANGTDKFDGVVEYSIASNKVYKSGAKDPTGVAIQKVNNALPYVIVQDWDTGATKSSSGTVVIKMTLKVGDNVVAAASKEFTVTPLASDNGADVNAYFQTVMTAYGNEDNALDISTIDMRNREHACITKGGIILNREDQNYVFNNSFGHIYVVDKGTTASTQAQWQIDYKFTVYGFAQNDIVLKQYFHVGDGTNGAGNIDVKKASGGNIDSWGWLTATGDGEGQSGAETDCYQPAASGLPTIYVRITRTVGADNTVTLTCLFSEDGVTYKRAYERHGKTVDPITNDGNIGNPLNYVRLEKPQGSSPFGLEYVKVTSLDAPAPAPAE